MRCEGDDGGVILWTEENGQGKRDRINNKSREEKKSSARNPRGPKFSK